MRQSLHFPSLSAILICSQPPSFHKKITSVESHGRFSTFVMLYLDKLRLVTYNSASLMKKLLNTSNNNEKSKLFKAPEQSRLPPFWKKSELNERRVKTQERKSKLAWSLSQLCIYLWSTFEITELYSIYSMSQSKEWPKRSVEVKAETIFFFMSCQCHICFDFWLSSKWLLISPRSLEDPQNTYTL